MEPQDKHIKPEHLPIDEFDDYSDNEFLEAVEQFELMRKKKLTPEEFEKLEYIRNSRKNMVSGDT